MDLEVKETMEKRRRVSTPDVGFFIYLAGHRMRPRREKRDVARDFHMRLPFARAGEWEGKPGHEISLGLVVW